MLWIGSMPQFPRNRTQLPIEIQTTPSYPNLGIYPNAAPILQHLVLNARGYHIALLAPVQEGYHIIPIHHLRTPGEGSIPIPSPLLGS